MSKQRLFYIDNLRIVLTILVVLHHFAITYGAPGGWYYNESQADFPEVIPMAMFVASNQAFFMGMFFFISAFFIAPSLQRKGKLRFISDRLLRLGIPTLVFYFILSPLTVFIRDRFIEQNDTSFVEYLQRGWGMGFGPMWFVEALLLFSAIYLLMRELGPKIKWKFPSSGLILLCATTVGMGQFLIRIKMPVGTSHEFTNFQWPFFLQYIVLFPMGIIAWQNNWMEHINRKMGWRWFAFAQVLIFIAFPLSFGLGGVADEGLDKFMGGAHWQCLVYSLWEQLLGFSLILGLLGIFKSYFNKQGKFAQQLSGSAYGVYIFHAPLLLIVSAVFLDFTIPQLLKFIVLAPVSLVFCFALAWLLKQIPGVKQIL